MESWLFMDLEKNISNPYNKPEILIAKRQPTTRSGSNYFTFHIVNETGFLMDITMDILSKVIE